MKNIPEFSWIGCVHQGIPVANENLDECIKFYREVFARKLLSRPKTVDRIGLGDWLENQDNTLQFHPIPSDETSIPGQEAQIDPMRRHTAWEIEDVDVFLDHLSMLQIKFKKITGLLGSFRSHLTKVHFDVDRVGPTIVVYGPDGLAPWN